MKTWKKYLIVAIIAFIAGAAFEYWFMTSVWPKRHSSYTWIYNFRNHRKPGEPGETDLVIDRKGYSLGYNYKHKAALWVSYIISEGSVGIDLGKRGNFYADSEIPEEHRVQPEDHLNTGYDKGHLAPSATIDFSKKANRETYALSNVVLQDEKLNRQAWSTLEKLERSWTKTKGKLYVVTGPVFTSRPKKVNGIAVPSKLYKVIYSYDADKAIGFIFPNKPVSNEDVWKYALSVTDVEEKSKLTFFSNFNETTQKQLKENVDIAWWQEE